MQEVEYDISSLDLSTIRDLVWEAMCSKWSNSHSSSDSYRAKDDTICWAVIELAINKNLIKNPAHGLFGCSIKIAKSSHKLVASVLWELVIQGILFVESPSSSTYNITEYGLKVLAAEKPIPHDPEGYLAYLKKEVPNIDDVVFTYISESVNAYDHRLYLSATTAIGCASEKAFLLLIEADIGFLPTKKEQDAFRNRTNGRFVKVQFEEFRKSFGGQRGRVDKELLDGIEIDLDGIFEMLRQNRNSTGHPTGKTIKRERVFTSLQVFVTYCKRIYALINFFQSNTTAFDVQ